MTLSMVKDLPPNEQAIFLSLISLDTSTDDQYVLNAASARHYYKVYMAQINSLIAALPTEGDPETTAELRALLRRVHHSLEESYQMLLVHNADLYPRLAQLSQQIEQQSQSAHQELNKLTKIRSNIEMLASVFDNIGLFARVAAVIFAVV